MKLGADGSIAVSTELTTDNDFAADILGLAVDDAGSAALIGTFEGVLVLSGHTMTTPANVGSSNSFVAKVGPSGQYQWSTVLPSDSDRIAGLGVTPGGDVYVSGQGCYPNFGAGPIDTGSHDDFCSAFFVAKLAGADGHHLWGKGASDDAFTHDFTGPLVVLADDGVAVTGSYRSSGRELDFGGGALPSTADSVPFVVMYDANGALKASRTYPTLTPGSAPTAWGAAATQRPTLKMAPAPGGGLIIAGPSVPSTCGSGRVDNEILSLAADGSIGRTWAISACQGCSGAFEYGGRLWFSFNALAVAPSGAIAVAGAYAYGLTVGTKSFCAYTQASAQDDAVVIGIAP